MRPLLKKEPQKTLERKMSYVKVSKMRPENEIDGMTATLISELMSAVSSLHKFHLSITGESSYARHMALNEAYDALPDIIDTIAEGYQGACEVLFNYPPKEDVVIETMEECVAYMKEIVMQVDALQEVMPHSEVVNNLDLVKDIINKLKYKLLFLG